MSDFNWCMCPRWSWKRQSFHFDFRGDLRKISVLEAEPFEWRENTKFKNALCRSSSCEWDDRAAFLLFITGKLRLHLLISVCWLFALWFLGALIRESRPGSCCFWVVLQMSKKNSLAPSLFFKIIVCYCFWMGLGFQMLAGPVSTNSKLLGLCAQRE